MGRQFTETLKEGQAIACAIPIVLNNTSMNTGNGINMACIRRARAVLMLGTLTGAASVNLAFQASATSGGSFTTITLTGTSTSLTGITTDDQPNAIEITADQMPAGKKWLRAIATETATANAVAALILIGDCAAYSPGNQFDTVTWTNNVVGSTTTV